MNWQKPALWRASPGDRQSFGDEAVLLPDEPKGMILLKQQSDRINSMDSA